MFICKFVIKFHNYLWRVVVGGHQRMADEILDDESVTNNYNGEWNDVSCHNNDHHCCLVDDFTRKNLSAEKLRGIFVRGHQVMVERKWYAHQH